MNYEIGIVVSIVAICYLIGDGVKYIPKIKDELIPVIVGACGGILGVVGMHTMPSFPANDILTAVAVGISSGLASTGTNQIFKQLTSKKEE